MKKHTWKIVLLSAVVLFGGSIVFSQNVANKANDGVTIESHIKGNPDASVTLTEYSDFECPACGQFFPFVQEIMAEHGDSIRFEYKHFPLISIHQFAVVAAKASEAAAQQGKFWEMHDKLFENQSVWTNTHAPQTYFNQYAEEIGLDVGLFKTHMNASVINDAVSAGYREAQTLGLTSTPSFYLNGEKMAFGTFEDFVGQIEAAVGVGSVEGATTTDTGTRSDSVSGSDIEFGI